MADLNVATLTAKLRADKSEFERDIRGATDSANASLQKMSRGALVAGAGLAAGLGVAVGAAMNFDKEMSAVKAATRASAEGMDALREAALQAGKDTAFSASEAAQAEKELAKAGIAAGDILSGALRGSLDLASAGQIGLADSAAIAANAMTQFKLEGKDVSHIADVIAAGAEKSATDVHQLSMALKQGGLVASQLGLSLEDTVGTLAAFAQGGLEGSDAGTSFKTMLQRLTPMSEEAASAMKDLGLDFFDAQGKFIGVAGVAGELKDSLGRLSTEQRATAMTTIFGSDAVRAANILYEQGADGIAEWTKLVNDQGFASETAATKMDNLAGDLEELRGSIETALIESGSSATGVLRGMTQAATGAVNQIAELPAPVQAAGFGMTALTSAGLLALGAIGTLVPRVRDARKALTDMGAAGAAANRGIGWLGRVGGAATGILAVVTAAQALSDAFTGLELDVEGLATRTDRELVTAFSGIDEVLGMHANPQLKIFNELLEKSPSEAQRVADALKAAGHETGFLQEKIDAEVESQKAMNEAMAADAALTDIATGKKGAYGGAVDGATKEIEELTDAQKDLQSAIQSFFSPLDAYTDRLNAEETWGRAMAEQAAETQNRAVDDQIEAIDRHMQKRRESVDKDSKNYGAQIEAIDEWEKNEREKLDASRTTWEDHVETVNVSTKEYIAELQSQVTAQAEWEKNLKEIAARGRSDVALELAAMGPEGAALVQEMATATDAELNKVADLFKKQGKKGGDNYTRELQAALRAADPRLKVGIDVEPLNVDIRLRVPEEFAVTVQRPNVDQKVPTMHEGGIFHAPPGRNEGPAILEDGERVIANGDGPQFQVIMNQTEQDPLHVAAAIAWKLGDN